MAGWKEREVDGDQERFNRGHMCRGRRKPDCRIAGSSIKVELTTLADRQSSLQRAAISIGTMSSHRGCLDFSRFSGWQVRSLCRPHSGCSKVFATSLSVLALRRRYGGCIFERAGSHGRGQERTVPVMIHMDALNCVLLSLV